MSKWLILEEMRLGTATALLVALLAAGPAARADEERSLQHYREGKEHYRAGAFDRAVESFRAAYREEPAKAYLFNIAQAYRRLGECEPALEHYRRYVAEGAAEKSREVVEKHIEALSAECGGAAEGKPAPGEASPADPAPDPDGAGAPAGARVRETGDPAREPRAALREPHAALREPGGGPGVELAAGAGAALFDIGGVEVPVVAGARLGAGVSWRLGGVDITPRLSVGLFPVRYEHEAAGTAYLVSVLAGGAAAVELGRRVRVRGEIGAGDLVFAGLGAGNPFTANAASSGALHMPSARIAGGVDVRLRRALALRVTAALAYGRAHGDLADDIEAIVRGSLLVGLAYRL